MDSRPLPNEPVPAPLARTAARPVALPGIVLGVGLGGFVDGIVLHQILRWHHMLSFVLPPTTMRNMEFNMVWDGYFHAGVWAITLVGVLLLWGAGRRGAYFPPLGAFLGQLLFGWALFNLVEGFIDHHLLQLHHVIDVPRHEPAFDWIFLAVSAGLLGLGAVLMRPRGRRAV